MAAEEATNMQPDYIQLIVYLFAAFILISYRTLSEKSKGRLLKIPLGLAILYLLFKAAIPIFEYFKLFSTMNSLSIAAAVVLWMAIIRLIVFFIVDYFIRKKRGVAIPAITRDFALAILYVIIAMVVLKQKTDVNLGSLITTSAILTAVIGFAMQDTLGNLFSGLALQLENPYQIGDWIGFEGREGKVVGITWKSTKMLTRSEEMIFVPNNTIAKSVLINFSRPTAKHITNIEIGTDYNDPPHKVKQAITEVIKNHPKTVRDHQPLVLVTKYDNFSVNYKAFFATEDFASEGKTKAEILNDLWYKFKRCGIKIPYPIQEEWQIVPSDIEKEKIEKRKRENVLIEDTLARVDIFAKLTPEVRRDLTNRIAVLEFAAGETIIHQGDDPGPMYIIKEGECSVLVSEGEGEADVEVARLKEMQFFGEMSVLTGAPRTATVRATKETTCYEIEKQDLKAIFSNNTEALARVSEVLAIRQASLSKHKVKMEEEAKIRTEQQNQLMSKIKNFLGL